MDLALSNRGDTMEGVEMETTRTCGAYSHRVTHLCLHHMPKPLPSIHSCNACICCLLCLIVAVQTHLTWIHTSGDCDWGLDMHRNKWQSG